MPPRAFQGLLLRVQHVKCCQRAIRCARTGNGLERGDFGEIVPINYKRGKGQNKETVPCRLWLEEGVYWNWTQVAYIILSFGGAHDTE